MLRTSGDDVPESFKANSSATRRPSRRFASGAGRIGALCLVLAAFGVAPAAPTQAQAPHSVVVTLYKSRTIHIDRPFATAIVGSPDIADALPMTDRGLYIQARKSAPPMCRCSIRIKSLSP